MGILQALIFGIEYTKSKTALYIFLALVHGSWSLKQYRYLVCETVTVFTWVPAMLKYSRYNRFASVIYDQRCFFWASVPLDCILFHFYSIQFKERSKLHIWFRLLTFTPVSTRNALDSSRRLVYHENQFLTDAYDMYSSIAIPGSSKRYRGQAPSSCSKIRSTFPGDCYEIIINFQISQGKNCTCCWFSIMEKWRFKHLVWLLLDLMVQFMKMVKRLHDLWEVGVVGRGWGRNSEGA